MAGGQQGWLRWPVAGPAGCRRRIVRDGHRALSLQSQAFSQAFYVFEAGGVSAVSY